MKPSMKQGSYNVWILLGRVGPYATIERATCECAAGSVLPYAYTYFTL